MPVSKTLVWRREENLAFGYHIENGKAVRFLYRMPRNSELSDESHERATSSRRWPPIIDSFQRESNMFSWGDWNASFAYCLFYLFREWISANQDGLMLPCPLPEAKTPLWRQRYQLSWYSTLCDIECWHHGFGAKKPAGSRSCGTDPDHIWLMLVWSRFGCTFGRCFTYLNVSINQILSLVWWPIKR